MTNTSHLGAPRRAFPRTPVGTAGQLVHEEGVKAGDERLAALGHLLNVIDAHHDQVPAAVFRAARLASNAVARALVPRQRMQTEPGQP